MFELDEMADTEILSVVRIAWHHAKFGTLRDLGVVCTAEMTKMIEAFDIKSDQYYILETDLSGNKVILFTTTEMEIRQWRAGQKLTWTYSLFDCEFQFRRI